MSKNKYTVYTADNKYTWGEMFVNVLENREIIWQLISRDVKLAYRQSFLGYIWAFIPQIMAVVIFSYIAHRRSDGLFSTEMPYVLHVLWSISLWQLFGACVIGCTNSLNDAGTLVTKLNFPKETLVLSAVGKPFFDFLIRLLPVIAAFIWFQYLPSVKIILVIPLVFICILMAVGVGFVLSILNLVFRDVGKLVGVALTLGVFISPVFYAFTDHGFIGMVNLFNPFSALLVTTQDLIVNRALTVPNRLIFSSLLTIFLVLVGWRMFSIAMPRIVERA